MIEPTRRWPLWLQRVLFALAGTAVLIGALALVEVMNYLWATIS